MNNFLKFYELSLYQQCGKMEAGGGDSKLNSQVCKMKNEAYTGCRQNSMVITQLGLNHTHAHMHARNHIHTHTHTLSPLIGVRAKPNTIRKNSPTNYTLAIAITNIIMKQSVYNHTHS